MSKKTVCCWCLAPIKVADNFNEKKQKAVCSEGCRDAERLFTTFYSDEEINRRRHYDELIRGGK